MVKLAPLIALVFWFWPHIEAFVMELRGLPDGILTGAAVAVLLLLPLAWQARDALKETDPYG